MNNLQKAYVAGIIDGEGTITLIRQHSNQNYSPEVSIANTSLKLMEWLNDRIKGGCIIKKRKKYKHHSQAYTWKLRGNKAIELLNQIYGLLILKRVHAWLIISDYKKLTPRNGKYTADQLRKKMQLVAKIKDLNSR